MIDRRSFLFSASVSVAAAATDENAFGKSRDASDHALVADAGKDLPRDVWNSKFRSEFRIADYLRSIDPGSAEAVEACDVDAQKAENILAAVRQAGDDMLGYVKRGIRRGGTLQLPLGTIGLKDELFSDLFQSAIWENTDLGSGKSITIAGASAGGSQIEIRPDYVSCVRNSLNGNQRAYGPWANGPSPSILIPMIRNAPNPIAFSVQRLRLFGSGIPGVDPIPWFAMGELGGIHYDVRCERFANSAHCVHGSFNSVGSWLQFVSNGFQPTRVGKRLDGVPGIAPSWLAFDVDARSRTIRAKAAKPANGYNVGDVVPYFSNDDVGKTIVIQGVLNSGNDLQPLKTTITRFMDPTRITFAVPGGYPIITVSGTGLSFPPVRATTRAGSAEITLTDPVLWGRGARDMIGQIITVPKAGSRVQTDRDLFVSRVTALSDGDDTSGYTSVTVADSPRFSVTEDLIVTSGHHTSMDETAMVGHPISRMDDTDHTNCRWENGATGSYQFVMGSTNSAVTYTGCKWHGTTSGNQFAGEGQAIVDNARSLALIGCDITHMGIHGDGCLRVVGWSGNIRLPGLVTGGYRIGHDFAALFIDPMTGFSPQNWGISIDGLTVANAAFRSLDQKLVAGRVGLTAFELTCLTVDRKRRNDHTNELTSTDDLNDIILAGNYSWGTDTPANTPVYGGRASLIVLHWRAEITQIIFDRDNHISWARDYTTSWSDWRLLEGKQLVALASLHDKSSALNTKNKRVGVEVIIKENGSRAIASDGDPAGDWWVYAPTSIIRPGEGR